MSVDMVIWICKNRHSLAVTRLQLMRNPGCEKLYCNGLLQDKSKCRETIETNRIANFMESSDGDKIDLDESIGESHG